MLVVTSLGSDVYIPSEIQGLQLSEYDTTQSSWVEVVPQNDRVSSKKQRWDATPCLLSLHFHHLFNFRFQFSICNFFTTPIYPEENLWENSLKEHPLEGKLRDQKEKVSPELAASLLSDLVQWLFKYIFTFSVWVSSSPRVTLPSTTFRDFFLCCSHLTHLLPSWPFQKRITDISVSRGTIPHVTWSFSLYDEDSLFLLWEHQGLRAL